jgi:hypothetical protein
MKIVRAVIVPSVVTLALTVPALAGGVMASASASTHAAWIVSGCNMFHHNDPSC